MLRTRAEKWSEGLKFGALRNGGEGGHLLFVETLHRVHRVGLVVPNVALDFVLKQCRTFLIISLHQRIVLRYVVGREREEIMDSPRVRVSKLASSASASARQESGQSKSE